MAQTSTPADLALRPGSRWGIAAPVLAVVSLIVNIALAVGDTARATSQDALRSLGFGRPFNWLVQDQTSADPPSYPSDHSFGSPWDHSVTLDALPLLLDFTLVLVILCGIWLAVHRLASRR